MTRVIVNGACGRMGRQMCAILEEKGAELGLELAGRADICAGDGVYPDVASVPGEADVVVDFSFHTSAPALMEQCVSRGLAVVVCTTGHTDDEMAAVRAASEKIAVFHSANMSLGVALLVEFAKKAAAAFPDADIEIVEAHHNRKEDAPSGTALTLAKAVAGAREGSFVETGRSGWGKRKKGEVTVHALRMGNIVGQHEVLVTTDNQQLCLRHEAYSRALFAEGAASAAAFLAGKAPGFYSMEDLAK